MGRVMMSTAWALMALLAAGYHSIDPSLESTTCSFNISTCLVCHICCNSALFSSIQPQAYSQLEGESHVVNTAWALMALLAAGYHSIDPKPLDPC
jgi:hypothetical protein